MIKVAGIKLPVIIIGISSGLMLSSAMVASPHNIQTIQAASVATSTKINPVHVGDQIVQGTGPAKTHLTVAYRSGVLAIDTGVETDENGHWEINLAGNSTFTSPLKAGDTFSVNGQTSTVAPMPANSTSAPDAQNQQLKLDATHPDDTQISGVATPNSTISLYYHSSRFELSEGQIKVDQNGRFTTSTAELERSLQVDDFTGLEKGATIIAIDHNQNLSPNQRVSLSVVGQETSPATAKELTLDQPLPYPESNSFSGTGIPNHQIQVYHQSNSGLNGLYGATVNSQGRWSLDIADQADDDNSTVRSGDLIIAFDNNKYTVATVANSTDVAHPTQVTQENLQFTLLNGIPANYNKALTIKVLDHGKVITTKTLPATNAEEPSQSSSGISLSKKDNLVKDHTYDLQIWADNQQEKAEPSQFKFGEKASLDVAVDAQAYQEGQRHFQLIDSQTKAPIQAKVIAVPNLTDKNAPTVTKEADKSGLVTFSTSDQNFLRSTLYHIEVPGYQAVGGVLNWNLIGGETDPTPTKIELKKVASTNDGHQKAAVPSPTTNSAGASTVSNSSAGNSSTPVNNASGTSSSSVSAAQQAASLHLLSHQKKAKSSIRVKSQKAIHSKAVFKIKHSAGIYKDSLLKHLLKRSQVKSLRGWKLIKREIVIKGGHQATYYQIKNKHGQTAWVSKSNLKAQR